MFAKAFTDGSVHGKRAGWAWVCGGKNASGGFASRDSYEAELIAVCKCLEEAEGPLCIVCDHWGICQELRDLIAGAHSIKKCEDTWDRIYAAKDVLHGVEWMRRNTTPEQRLAHNMASCARDKGRG